MGDIQLIICLSVQLNRLYVTVLVAHFGCTNLNRAAVLERHLHVGHVGSPQDILIRTRTDGIEAHRREDIPGGHLTAVIVAAETADMVAVHLVHDGAQPLLRLPGL